MNGYDRQSGHAGGENPGNPCRYARRRHRGLGAAVLLVAGGLLGAGLVTAYGVAAHSERGGYGMTWGGMHGGGMGVEGHMPGGGMGVEGQMPGGYMHGDGARPGGYMHGESRHGGHHGDGMQRRVEFLLDEVEASDEQREEVHALFEDMFKQMHEMRGHHFDQREEMIAALTAPEVDRAALEKVRAQHLADMQARSALMVENMAKLAEVLTPEQRALVAEYFRKHGRRF